MSLSKPNQTRKQGSTWFCFPSGRCNFRPLCCPNNTNLLCANLLRFSAWWYTLLKNKQKYYQKSTCKQVCFYFDVLFTLFSLFSSYLLFVFILDIKFDLPIYLYGFSIFDKLFKQLSTTRVVHWLTLLCWYVLPPIDTSIASLMILLTSSTTNCS